MFRIVIYVPTTHADGIRTALTAGGAGAIGDYDSCSFSVKGQGRFRPLANANPFIGKSGHVEVVEEERIETVLMNDKVASTIRAVRAAHPYEEPAIHLLQVLDYKMFLRPEEDVKGGGGDAATLSSTTRTTTTTSSSSSSSSSTSQIPLPLSPPPISVVIEGLDGVGKSTLVKNLVKKLHAVALRTPPDEMRAYREYFHHGRDDESNVIARERRFTYYMLGNFMAGTKMKEAVEEKKQNVVIDRYYASSQAYILGKQIDTIPLPPAGNEAYSWPSQLVRPMKMLLLTLPQEDRVKRRSARTAVAETAEEELLVKRPDIAAAIEEAYRRFGCEEVKLRDDDTEEECVRKVLCALGEEYARAYMDGGGGV